MKPKHETWFEPHGEHGPEVICLCGWRKRHARAKVRDRAAAVHLARTPDVRPDRNHVGT